MAADPFDAPFVHVMGGDLAAGVELHANPAHVDHVWISLDAGIADRVTVSINTLSVQNRNAGFDSRVRVGFLRGTWTSLPPRGAKRCTGFDYAEIEREANIFYEHFERAALEKLLLETTARAHALEVWGTPYRHRRRPGLHQIHSRRASFAVLEDIQNRDGALQFYFAEDHTTSLFLFKFNGQP